MRLHRFFVDQPLTDSLIRISDKELLHQWSRVLRYSEGVQVVLLDGKGSEVTGTLIELSSKQALVEVVSRREQAASSESVLTLYFSPLKRELTELVFQKGTELGVSVFQPILCDRTVRDGFNPERTARILREAAEQSGRLWLPEFRAPISFEEALKTNQSGCTYFATLDKEVSHVSHKKPDVTGSIALFVGPEGGWTEEEESLARTAGYQPFHFSSNILRAETACIAGVALLLAV